MNLQLALRKTFAFIKGIEEQDYINCDKLCHATGLSWKPEHVHVGYADTDSARYVVKSDGSVPPSELQKTANKALFGNEDRKQPGQSFVYIMRDQFMALKL